ncbi:MAG: type II toxin-antitoxin system CcdA family antitoxin [Dehalococcoidia bacterium]|nr:type II toxin-antitoxin system CcdA family antitoxin [Dehalococcoidia bacterium]
MADLLPTFDANTSATIEDLLRDAAALERADRWVERAMARRDDALLDGSVVYPPLGNGVFVSAINVCDRYGCQCGWNLTVTGRDPDRRARLDALAARPPDPRFGSFKLLAAHDGPRLWTVTIAGDDVFGLDAVIAVLGA